MTKEEEKRFEELMTDIEEKGAVKLEKIFALITKESDRGCVLVIADMIDGLLEELLLKYLKTSIPDKPSVANELVDGFNSPLGTFSSRIKMAYALNLLKYDLYHNLEKIRACRNEMAHSEDIMTFDTESISKILKSIDVKKDGLSNRDIFLIASVAIITEIIAEIKFVDMGNIVVKNPYYEFFKTHPKKIGK